MIINEAALKKLIREAVREELEEHILEKETYLTMIQAAERIGVARSTMDRLVREESLPTIRINAMIRIKNSSLQEWLDKKEVMNPGWRPVLKEKR